LNFLEPLIEQGIEDLLPRLMIDKSVEARVRSDAFNLSQQLVARVYRQLPHAPATVAAGILATICELDHINISKYDVAKRTGVDYTAFVMVSCWMDELLRAGTIAQTRP
jgi:hypothetical protein